MAITQKNYFVQNQISQMAGLQNKVSFMMKARADWYRNRAEKISKLIGFMSDLISIDADDIQYFKDLGLSEETIRQKFEQGINDVVTFVNGAGQQCVATVGSVVEAFLNNLDVHDPSSDPDFIPIPVSPVVPTTRSSNSNVYMKDLTEYYSNNYYSMKGRSSMYSFLSDKGLSADFNTSELRDSITRDLNIDWIPAEVQDIIGPLPSTVNVLTVLQTDCSIIENAYSKYDGETFTAQEFDYSMTDAIQDALGDILDGIGAVVATFGKVIVAMIKGAEDIGQLIGTAVMGLVNLIFPNLGTWYSKADNANALGLGIPYAQVKGDLPAMIEGYITALRNRSFCFKNNPSIVSDDMSSITDSILKNNLLTPCLVGLGSEAEGNVSESYLDSLYLKMYGFMEDTIMKTGILVLCLGNVVIQITGESVHDALIELYLTNQYPTNANDHQSSSDLIVLPGQEKQDIADGNTLANCYFNDLKFYSLATLPVHAYMYGSLHPSYEGHTRTFTNEHCVIANPSKNDTIASGTIHEYSNIFIDWSQYYNNFVLYNIQNPGNPREVEPRDFINCLRCFNAIKEDPTYNIISNVQDYNNKASLGSAMNGDPLVGIVVNTAMLMLALSSTNPASDPYPSSPIDPFEDTLIRNVVVQWTYSGGGTEHEYIMVPAYSATSSGVPTFISSSADDDSVYFAYLTDASPVWEFKPMSMQDKSNQVRPYLLAILCAAALAAVTVVSSIRKKRLNKKRFIKQQKMEDAELDYFLDPTQENFNKLQKATKQFNKVAGLNYVLNPIPLGSMVVSGSRIGAAIINSNGRLDRDIFSEKLLETNSLVSGSNGSVVQAVNNAKKEIISG